MDIEEFYDADPRRRASTEIELGLNWRDDDGVRYELSWVQDTGELYIVREGVPRPPKVRYAWLKFIGGRDSTEVEEPGAAMTVHLLGTVADRATLERTLEGWESEMPKPDSVAWLDQRLRERGILEPGT